MRGPCRPTRNPSGRAAAPAPPSRRFAAPMWPPAKRAAPLRREWSFLSDPALRELTWAPGGAALLGEFSWRTDLRGAMEINRGGRVPIAGRQLKSGGVAALPIRSLLVQRLHTRIVPWPVGLHDRIALVDLLEEFLHRAPSKIVRDLCPDVQVKSGKKQISLGTRQTRNVWQTNFPHWRRHVAEKVSRHHDVLGSPKITDPHLPGIADTPLDPLPDPGFDRHLVPVPLERLLDLGAGHALQNV